MAQDIVGSKIKTFPSAPGVRERQSGYGQNGFAGASSLLPGEKVDRSPIMQGIAEPDPDAKAADGWQTRTVSAAPLKPAFAQKSPNKSPAKVPAANKRADKAGVVRPTR
jgi:hypothetical protein